METPKGNLKLELSNLLSNPISLYKSVFIIPGLKVSKSLPDPGLFSSEINKLLNCLIR